MKQPIPSIAIASVALSIFLAGCANTPTTASSSQLLGPKQARITGKRAMLTTFIYIAEAKPGSNFKRELIIPAGRNELALKWSDDSGFPDPLEHEIFQSLNRAVSGRHIKTVTLNAVAGHEYEVARTKGIWDMEYRITDKATGQLVAETKTTRP